MNGIACFFIFALSFSVSAQTPEKEDQGQKDLMEKRGNYQINGRYKAGNNLIYDCKGGYYACVDKDGFELCENKRKDGIEAKEASYACAPLKQYDEKTKCIIKNYNAIDAVTAKRFCYPK